MTFNFSAGPSALPRSIIEEARDQLVDYAGTDMSLIEMSHRGAEYSEVHDEAVSLARTVFGVPDDFSVLFLQGGATLQFSMVPMNLLQDGASGAYVLSGAWGKKAYADAPHYGDAYVAWDGESAGYARMPRPAELELKEGTRYLHVTSNETIHGIQMVEWPDLGVPLVADMSSDMISRAIPWERFDLVYGGAQKNLGPAGAAIVFVRDMALESQNRDLGMYLRYDVHARGNSLYNTPPMFVIWMIGKMLRWVRDQGGLDAMEAAAQSKAAALYGAIDASEGFYTSPVEPGSRSLMNVVFRLQSDELTGAFLEASAAAGLVGLKGHRDVGGVRASIYNAVSTEAVSALADFMVEFKAERG